MPVLARKYPRVHRLLPGALGVPPSDGGVPAGSRARQRVMHRLLVRTCVAAALGRAVRCGKQGLTLDLFYTETP